MKDVTVRGKEHTQLGWAGIPPLLYPSSLIIIIIIIIVIIILDMALCILDLSSDLPAFIS